MGPTLLFLFWSWLVAGKLGLRFRLVAGKLGLRLWNNGAWLHVMFFMDNIHVGDKMTHPWLLLEMTLKSRNSHPEQTTQLCLPAQVTGLLSEPVGQQQHSSLLFVQYFYTKGELLRTVQPAVSYVAPPPLFCHNKTKPHLIMNAFS